MSESSISKRVPDPAVRVSTTDGHRMLTPPGQPEPERPGQVQRPAQAAQAAQRELVQPRRPPLTDTGKGRARPASPPPAAPSGVVIGQSASVFSTVSKGARVSTPVRPTTAHAHLEQRARAESSAPQAPETRGDLELSDAEIAFVGSLVQTFAATAGGEGLALAQAVGAKLAAEVEARDASEPATEAPQA